MNNDKYRVYLKTKQGVYLVATGTSVNGLLKQIGDWLDTKGKYLIDDDIIDIELQQLDSNGNFVDSERLPVERRSKILATAEELGAR